jgi:hypothetical protein
MHCDVRKQIQKVDIHEIHPTELEEKMQNPHQETILAIRKKIYGK